MGSRRTLILVAAIATGAIAAFLVWSYVGGIQDKAYGNAEKVTVFVVKKTVAKGTYGEEASAKNLIAKDEIPRKFFPSNAVRDLGTDLRDKVAVNDIAVNQIVTTDMFADPTTVQTTFADRLEKIRGKDQVAITISVDNVRGVANLLQPGDYVNVLVTNTCTGTDTSATGDGAATGDPVASAVAANRCKGDASTVFVKNARYLLQKTQILAIDQTPVARAGEVQAASGSDTTEPTATTPTNRGLITLIVPAKAAQFIASVDPTSIYLTLVPRDYEPTTQGVIDLSKSLPAEDPSELTPYGPQGPDGK